MAMKKLYRLECLVEESALHSTMTALAGKSYDLTVRAVVHGGTDEKGEPKSSITGPAFVQAYMAKHPEFATGDVVASSEGTGLTKATIYAAISALYNKKVIERTGSGSYKATGMPMPALGNTGRPVSTTKGKAKPKPGETHRDQILAILKKQTGDGGISLKQLKKEIGNVNLSPALTDMVRKKEIKRVDAGVYRVNG